MSEVEQLEKQKQELKEMIRLYEMAQRLVANKDFKELILDFWCEKECARYAQVSGDPQLSEEIRKDSLAMAQAAGHFKRFLDVVQRRGIKAFSDLEEIDHYIAIEE